MRIGVLYQQLVVTPDAIRFYERQGLLPTGSARRERLPRLHPGGCRSPAPMIGLRRLDLPLFQAADSDRIVGALVAVVAVVAMAEVVRPFRVVNLGFAACWWVRGSSPAQRRLALNSLALGLVLLPWPRLGHVAVKFPVVLLHRPNRQAKDRAGMRWRQLSRLRSWASTMTRW